MFKSLPKSKYPTEMLYFLTEHTLIIYVQYIKGSKRKNSYLLEKLFEKDLIHFVSDSIFKRLKFDYSSSETVSNQKIKIKNYFLDDCVFLEIRITHENQLIPNITRNKWVTVFSNLVKYTWNTSCRSLLLLAACGSFVFAPGFVIYSKTCLKRPLKKKTENRFSRPIIA